MLVKVRFGDSQKYVKVAETETGCEDYSIFLLKVIEKLGLPLQTSLHLTDASGTEVDAEVFEDLLQAGNLTVNVSTEQSVVLIQNSPEKNVLVSDTLSSAPSDSSGVTPTRNIGSKRTYNDCETAKEMVQGVLQSKSGGEQILLEYDKTKALSDGTRRRMVNLLVADMIEHHGRIPPSYIRTKYALGIVTLFPNLRDPYSNNGYEHYYDAESGAGFLAWRIKTVQRSTAVQSQRSYTSSTYREGPNSRRDLQLTDVQLLGDECLEAISLLRHSTEELVVREKMRATFQYRQTLVHDQERSSTVLDVFPRYLDTPGLIDQDFTMMFGEDVSGRFLAKWPTYFKPRILAECRKLGSNEHFVDLLSAQENSNDSGWDGDLASILLLVHLLPPTYSRNSAKISAYQAAERVVKYLRIGANMENFLQSVAPGQPFLLCVGEKKSSIQKFFIIADHRALPCKSQTSLGAFDELFKSHFIFSISYPHPLNSFYTFLQSTVYNIDVGSVKESPRVKELRARLLNSDL